MATILRQIVAGPRARHPEAGLDLCYVTDYIVVTSGPSSVWPKKAYRNPVDQLVAFLDKKHGQDWCIFEFRAEGTGYPDSEVYGRIRHFPWPDHHPPPFAILPNIMAAMRNWIKRLDEEPQPAKERRRRIAVVHCKAGKGRSGTVSTSYLISEEGWKREDALQRFTTRRMRAGFGQGVSIPSQLRYVGYVDRWANELGKKYTERRVEIVEVHVWGLRDGVKVAVEGYVDGGKTIQNFHTFTRDDKTVVEHGSIETKHAPMSTKDFKKDTEFLTSPTDCSSQSSEISSGHNTYTSPVQTVILKPPSALILPTSDVNIDFERRNRAGYTGFTMVTSIAHVWFNVYFEGGSQGHDSGVFEIDWDAMDGIKGSKQKGIQALDRLKVVWRYANEAGHEIEEPQQGHPVPESEAADWQGPEEQQPQSEASNTGGGGSDGGLPVIPATLTLSKVISQGKSGLPKTLGLRLATPESANISRAASLKDIPPPDKRKTKEIKSAEEEDGSEQGVKTHIPQTAYGNGGGLENDAEVEERETRQDTKVGEYIEVGLAKVAGVIARWKGEADDDKGSK
ncbi:hypothetical protein DV736_g6345, partial [Chaetothyriales sp. CBS 134916]